MSHRVLEIIAPQEKAAQVESSLGEFSFLFVWCLGRNEEVVVWRALTDAETVEPVLDRLENRFGHVAGFRALLQSVEAVVPAPAEPEPEPGDAPPAKVARISRPELYEGIAGESTLSWRFVVMVLLAAIVVTVGLVRDSSVIVLAAMVIAPLLGPNMALALGTTLGDTAMTRRSARAAGIGFAAAFVPAVLYGLIGQPPLDSAEIVARTGFDGGDLILALAAGVAGTLAFTTGASSSLIGVMVAVALLPPTVVAGFMVGRGAWPEAMAAVLLLASNVLCVHLAAVGTFLAQGVKPSRWWEAEKAKRASRYSLTISTGLFVGLIALLIVRAYVLEG
jgi:uncharacterized hydrophobic protein (TIGR00341 family)